jgi:hypothetical protein
MNPKKKSRHCRGLGLDSGLDSGLNLAISRFIYSFEYMYCIINIMFAIDASGLRNNSDRRFLAGGGGFVL